MKRIHTRVCIKVNDVQLLQQDFTRIRVKTTAHSSPQNISVSTWFYSGEDSKDFMVVKK